MLTRGNRPWLQAGSEWLILVHGEQPGAGVMRTVGFVLLALAMAAPASARDLSLIGTWTITGGVPAPWLTGPYPEGDAAIARLKGKTMVFKADTIVAPSVLGCTEAGYEITHYPPEALFQGTLPEGRQAAAAAGLGLPAGEVPGIDVGCSTGLFSYHFKDANTAMVALDNVIYTLARQ